MIHLGHHIFTPDEIELLGTLPDHELAHRFGCPPSSVQHKRLHLKKKYINPRYRWWPPEETRLLGTKPDAEIAALVGRPIQAVKLQRHKLGISNFFPAERYWK